MDNHQIEHLLNNHPETRTTFKGVYSRDTLPPKHEIIEDEFYIINYDNEGEPGSHWVSVHLSPNANNEYFDSYGWIPLFDSFTNFMHNCYEHNKQQLQHPLSAVCGQYCIFYIWQRNRGLTLNEIVKLFKEGKYLINDITVNSAIQNEFKTRKKIFNINMLRQWKRQLCVSARKNLEYFHRHGLAKYCRLRGGS